MQVELDMLNEEIEIFINESEYMDADWPVHVYTPQIGEFCLRPNLMNFSCVAEPLTTCLNLNRRFKVKDSGRI